MVLYQHTFTYCSRAVRNPQQNIVEKHCDGSGIVQHSEKKKGHSQNGSFCSGKSASVRHEK